MKSPLNCCVAFGLAGFVPFAAHATVTPGCLNPVKFGAIANDGADDRDAFQTAIDNAINAQVDVCIPAGIFDLTRQPVANKLYSVRISGPVRITGEGRDLTVLKMLGSGMVGSGQFPGNWRFVEVKQAVEVYLADLALDGSNRVNTSEQTHLLHLSGPVDDVTAERLRLTLPVLAIPPGLYNCSKKYDFTGTYCYLGSVTIAGFFSGGDCTRFVGSAVGLVQNVVLRDVLAEDCDRTAFGIQRGVDDLLIEDSVGVCHDDQALDFEPSGNAPLGNVTIRGTTLARGSDGSGFTAAISGTGANPTQNVVIEETTITGGGLHIIGAKNVTLDRVTLDSGTVSASPTLFIEQVAENIQILQSTITRPAGAPTQDLIFVSHSGGSIPHDLTIRRSELTQNTAARVAYLASLGTFTMSDTDIEVTAPSTRPGIVADAVIASMEDVTFSSVNFSSAGSPALLRITGRPNFHVARAVVSDTTATGLSTYGVEYMISGGALPPLLNPVLSGNSFSSPTYNCFGYSGGGCVP